jgi:hypothetical protein
MKQLFEALSKAQGEFKSIPKNKEVRKQGVSKSGKPYEYSYFYADLESIIAHIRPILAKHGLTFNQTINRSTGELVTNIGHLSGEAVSSSCPVILDQNDPQKMGGGITYSKRYGLSLALGISTDDDLDGNELTDEEHKVTNRETKQATTPSTTAAELPPMPPTQGFVRSYPLSEKQVNRLIAIAKSNKWSVIDVQAHCTSKYGKAPKDLNKQQYEEACDYFGMTPGDSKPSGAKPSVMEQFEKAKKSGYVDHTAPPDNWDSEVPF